MVKIAKSTDENFIKFLDELMAFSSKAEMRPEVVNSAKKICDEVMAEGDDAVLKYTNMFDNVKADSVEELKVTETEIQLAYNAVSSNVIDALETAADRIESYHKKQMPKDIDYKDDIGVRLGNIWKPIKNVGIYVPGGLASYPSSVLMNAIPAKVAGVENIVMVVPAPHGKLSPSVLAAAKIAGIHQIYKIGGAQAIAAMATGTKSVPRVDMIVGPGNAYVAAAKRYFSGYVGIDMIAGPSEILVVADNKNSPEWIASDLLSQAEHDENARSILITDDEQFAFEVMKSVDKICVELERAEIAGASWSENGAVIIVEDLEKEVVDLIDWIAPEHLELALDDKFANSIVKDIKNAGAIFIGRFTPEAIGDYMAGPSHVLPTAGTARFSSGLSVYDFLKRISLIGCDKEAFFKLAKRTACLADEEGLTAHALSIRARHD
ncbi:MAG: histidinol dehydrogenase [Rickettsiales bacterium]|nr:histidinol dehydrogenase [Pseudomonadota bacterium]MDA0966181.1 histidinol dehydrogenase [Pseudomonadota bacterium]MDG4543154.1 histidinol dehydrogenase [Rickettsiales bacterium]MDG4545352.1 histidinol dehydrogenase [Rickettsiales bacterium]MDG4547801.1 histidinol dehydrogenase [Rickettsiales bacterium]